MSCSGHYNSRWQPRKRSANVVQMVDPSETSINLSAGTSSTSRGVYILGERNESQNYIPGLHRMTVIEHARKVHKQFQTEGQSKSYFIKPHDY